MVKSGLTESMALAMTLLLYAGSAQRPAAAYRHRRAVVADLRRRLRGQPALPHFGAALQPYFRHLSWPKRLGLGYFTTDMGFVLFMPRFGDAAERGTREQLWYFIGTVAPGWLVWQTSSIVGIYLGTMVPATSSLDFAAVLALLAITVPLATKPMLVSCWRPDWSPGSGRPCRCGWAWQRP